MATSLHQNSNTESQRYDRRTFLKGVGVTTTTGLVGSGSATACTLPEFTTLINEVPEDAWPQSAHDPGNTSYNPVATGPDVQKQHKSGKARACLYGSIEVKWQYRSPVGSIWLPTIIGDTLYAGDFNIRDPETSPGTVHAVDLLDGSERWHVNVANGATGATVVDDTVFVESWDTNVYALDAATGEERWRYEAPTAPPGEIHVYNDTVYIPGRDTTLYAVDMASGEERWRFEDITVGGPGFLQ